MLDLLEVECQFLRLWPGLRRCGACFGSTAGYILEESGSVWGRALLGRAPTQHAANVKTLKAPKYQYFGDFGVGDDLNFDAALQD